MPNTKKSQWATWLGQTQTLRASLNPLDPNELALYKFLRNIEKTAVRVDSDRDKG